MYADTEYEYRSRIGHFKVDAAIPDALFRFPNLDSFEKWSVAHATTLPVVSDMFCK